MHIKGESACGDGNHPEPSQSLSYLSQTKQTNADSGGGAKLLIVDDDYGIRRFLHASLSSHGFETREAVTGREALNAVSALRPDILILDLSLPDIDGVEIVRSLRRWNQISIIVVSVRDQEADKVEALDAGADDYLTKPFGCGELLARIRAALRRANSPETAAIFAVGDLSVDLNRRAVTLRGEGVQLTPTEYDLLKSLIRHNGRPVAHRQIIREIWGGGCYEDELHLLRVNISNLRRKLEQSASRPQYILTEPGIGYRLLNGE